MDAEDTDFDPVEDMRLEAEQAAAEESASRRNRGALLTLALVAAAVLAVALAWSMFRVIPDVRGMSSADAARAIERAGFHVASASGEATSGKVAEQQPEAGWRALLGTKVELSFRSATPATSASSVSTSSSAEASGSAFAVVAEHVAPDVVGKDAEVALAKIEVAGLKGRIVHAAASEPKGRVVKQSPSPGERMRANGVVTLTLSLGLADGESDAAPGPGTPNVLGMSASEARSTLRVAGYSVALSYRHSTTTPAGRVFYQDPGAGEEAGASVRVWVSTGPPKP